MRGGSEPFSVTDIERARERLGALVVETPAHPWRSPEVERIFGARTELVVKLELLQRTGTFKPRGALTVMLNLEPEQLERGVTTVSAGNHAIATAYAAQVLGASAKLVIPRTANPFRVQRVRSFGAELVLVADVHEAFAVAREIEELEGRVLVHPFEGPYTALGTATLGLELCRQVPELDAVIVPVGGGGLCAGVATAIKLVRPQCRIYAVEPEGADTMHRSFRSGKPESIESVETIADSLGAPHAEPYSFGLCREHVDELVLVDDDTLRRAMLTLFSELKLAVEPAGAASTAALWGPLRETLRDQRVALLVSGSNIDAEGFATLLAETREETKHASVG